MVRTVEYVQVLELGCSKFGFGKHAFHNLKEEGVTSVLESLVIRLLHQVAGCVGALAAGITCETEVFTLLHLVAVEEHLVGVHDHYIVAAVKVGCERRFVFAAEDLGDFRAETAEHQVGRVDNHPLLLDCLRGG